jgi:transcriptional regulator with XRE-family HTH domain
MASKNPLLSAPPYEVEAALRTLGSNLRTARLRRNLTLKDLAARLGASRQVLADAEAGKPTTGIGVYAGMLWALGLTDGLLSLAHPDADEEGKLLDAKNSRKAAGKPRKVDDDF